MDERRALADLPTVTLPDRIYSITEVTNLVKGVLEETVGTVWVEGEISNYTHHSSGHRYFSLKDEGATLQCVMWRPVGRSLAFEPEAGLRVRAHGRLTVYPPRGAYQLIVSRLVTVGVGPLEIAFQKLKEKLLTEGLFDEERKSPIPELPLVVGVVTSPTGAAFVDITETMAARHAGVDIVFSPVRVQGPGAAAEIVAAIRALNRRRDIDVLIVGRGGGSLEDLWPFNEEIVARAIAASRIPVISAVGHEVDFTIADGVADYRAATPTAAAQKVTEGWVRVREELINTVRRLRRAEAGLLQGCRLQLERIQDSHALRRPADLLDTWAQRLDGVTERARRAVRVQFDREGERTRNLHLRLEALSPDGVLRRGYSITRRRGQPAALRRAGDAVVGEMIETRLADGEIISLVRETRG